MPNVLRASNFQNLDWTPPPEPELVRALSSLALAELYAPHHLANLPARGRFREHSMVRFHSGWAVEEAGHGQAIVDALRAYGIEATQAEAARRAGEVRLQSAIATTRNRTIHWIHPRAFEAAYGTVGYLDELVARAVYKTLAGRTHTPGLAKLLRSIAAQEYRHAGHFRSAAVDALSSSTTAAWFVRRVVLPRWAPPGSGDVTPEITAETIDLLDDSDEFRKEVQKCDDAIAELPGLSGVRPFADFVERSAQRR